MVPLALILTLDILAVVIRAATDAVALVTLVGQIEVVADLRPLCLDRGVVLTCANVCVLVAFLGEA